MAFAEGYRSWETVEYTVLEDQVNIDMTRCDPYWAKADFMDEYLRDSIVELKMNDIEGSGDEWTSDPNNILYPLLPLAKPDGVVGIALNGVFLFSGTSYLGYDALFPSHYGTFKSPERLVFDACLGT